MRNIISFFPKDGLEAVADVFKNSKTVTFSGAGNSSSKAMIMSSVFSLVSGVENTLWVVNDASSQNLITSALKMWSDRTVFTYKKKEPDEVKSFDTRDSFERAVNIEMVEFVSRLTVNKNAVLVVDFQSLLQDFPLSSTICENSIHLKTGQDQEIVELIEKLVFKGYEATDDVVLRKGDYYRKGDSIFIYPVNCEGVYRIDFNFDKIEKIKFFIDPLDILNGEEQKQVKIFPLEYDSETASAISLLGRNCMVIDDEVDVVDEYYNLWNGLMEDASNLCYTTTFTSFNDDVKNHKHLHFLSVLKYRTAYDLANDLRDKINNNWKVFVYTKKLSETRGLLKDQNIPFIEGVDADNFNKTSIFLINVQKEDTFPHSFQNPRQKVILLNDTDILLFGDERSRNLNRSIFDDFLTSLKVGDYVVHSDHGVARFMGFDRKTIDNITKEYLKLGYAENDKLFVPIDQADKVNKYVGSEEHMPKLTRLGSAEWNTITSRVKKETQAIAKELLKLYAERCAAKGFKFSGDALSQSQFENTFPYEETPGQIKAINDVKSDMEKSEPMDRLICGDVGFGKTEVAMRAAFKAVQDQKQVAVISPITILADQHYKSFKKRMDDFNVRVDMLSRFRTPKEQKIIISKLFKGDLDIIIGTHRLIQPDVKFKNLGLVIIDEEQRFGVKQKEKLKELRKEVDILTLTATPIPRTLNICLNKLRDITTITTPPFGRLPIITEVRKFSTSLVRESILKEVERGGQVYFLHNRVQTIDSFTEKLKSLVPEARFGVAHGKLGSGDLEERIMAFKDHKYDVLVSSTIIENGIDLENANTLIVNNAERFGLSQLYQLRGRVGRGKRQAYAYFLYHGQRLKLDAKKRLRAIVEASELGSGFQIAMKDLEIRGAGDILGANQHGVISVVGVSHFMRMLNKAVEDLKDGRIFEGEQEIENVSIELPIPGYIPDNYIPVSSNKINVYQKLSSSEDLDQLKITKDELIDAYGKMPMEVNNLFKVIELKILAKFAGVLNVKMETIPMSREKEIVLYLSKHVKPANIVNLLEYNSQWQISGSRLKVNLKDLQGDWAEELKVCLKKLSLMAKHGAR